MFLLVLMLDKPFTDTCSLCYLLGVKDTGPLAELLDARILHHHIPYDAPEDEYNAEEHDALLHRHHRARLSGCP